MPNDFVKLGKNNPDNWHLNAKPEYSKCWCLLSLHEIDPRTWTKWKKNDFSSTLAPAASKSFGNIKMFHGKTGLHSNVNSFILEKEIKSSHGFFLVFLTCFNNFEVNFQSMTYNMEFFVEYLFILPNVLNGNSSIKTVKTLMST